MENALLISLSRQVALRKSMDVIANNMANINTAGFKADQMLFEEHIMPVANMTEGKFGDRRLSYVDMQGLYRDYGPGDMQQTGNELDVAIVGKGWLTVQTPDGERYTRDGQLKINAEGTLVTNEGFPVLGDGGPVAFDATETGISIAEDGTISSSVGVKGRLQLFAFENESELKKIGENLFEAAEDAASAPAANARIMQGMVEKSNVKPVLEMTRMIETIRAYTTISRNLEQAQELRSEAINQLGRTNNV